jgi:drug/metabolite transporter, DME family
MSFDPPRRAVTLAYLQVVLAGVLWATSGPFSIALYRMGIPPTSVAILRPATGVLFMALLLLPRGLGAFHLDRRGALGLLLLGGAVVGVFQLAYQMSTASVGVPATVALLYLAPAYVVGMSALFLREHLTFLRGGLAVLSVGGVWLTVLGTRGVDVNLTVEGVLWGCVCGISYGSYTLFGKVFGKDYGALVPLFWSTLGGTLLLTVTWALRGEPVVFPDSAMAWGVLLAFGFFTMAAAALLLFHAMGTLEAGRASIGTTVEPLAATLLAIALLDQTLTARGWLGMTLLLAGVMGAYASGAPRTRPLGPAPDNALDEGPEGPLRRMPTRPGEG